MIDRYTIKFGLAVSQKELQKALHDPNVSPDEYVTQLKLYKMKARIEFIDAQFPSDLLDLLAFQASQNDPRTLHGVRLRNPALCEGHQTIYSVEEATNGEHNSQN